MTKHLLILLLICFGVICASCDDSDKTIILLKGTAQVPDSLASFPIGIGALLDPLDEVLTGNNSDTVTSFYIPAPVFNTQVNLNGSMGVRGFELPLPAGSEFQPDLSKSLVIVAWVDRNLDGEFNWPYETGRFSFKQIDVGDSCLIIRIISTGTKDYSIECNNDTSSLNSIGYDQFNFTF